MLQKLTSMNKILLVSEASGNLMQFYRSPLCLLPMWQLTLSIFIFTDFYAPPTIVEGHYVFWSVPPFVRSSVRSSRFRLKFLVKVVFDEAEVQST